MVIFRCFAIALSAFISFSFITPSFAAEFRAGGLPRQTLKTGAIPPGLNLTAEDIKKLRGDVAGTKAEKPKGEGEGEDIPIHVGEGVVKDAVIQEEKPSRIENEYSNRLKLQKKQFKMRGGPSEPSYQGGENKVQQGDYAGGQGEFTARPGDDPGRQGDYAGGPGDFTGRQGELTPSQDDQAGGVDEKGVKSRKLPERFGMENNPVIAVPESIRQFGYEAFNNPELEKSNTWDIPSLNEYVLGPSDQITVDLYGNLSDSIEMAVRPDGTISLLNEKPFRVAGKTFGEVSRIINNLVKEKMIGTSANVNLNTTRPIRVFALGEVEMPGAALVTGASTISKVLSRAKGVKKSGSLRAVQLLRHGKKVATVDLYDFLLKGDTSRDLVVRSGDVVFVPPIRETIAVAGEVNRPAIYETAGKLSLKEALSMAGGVRPTSLVRLGQIERVSGGGKTRIIDFDFNKAGADIPLSDGDIIKIFSFVDNEDEESVVYAMGAFKFPGKRAFEKGMKLSELIRDNGELLADVFLEYATIERETGLNRAPEMVRFNLGGVLSGDKSADIELKPRDKVVIYSQSMFEDPPMAEVIGMVKNPGKQRVKKGMRALDLVFAAGGLTKDATPEFVEFYRADASTGKYFKQDVNLRKAREGSEADNPPVGNMDRLVVHSIFENVRFGSVSITGEVKKPGQYPLAEDASIEDLIYAAGGFTEKALRKEAEITRYQIKDGEKRVQEIIKVNLEESLKGDKARTVKLRTYDEVSIFQVESWDKTNAVTITGEVRFPGNYTIRKGETLSMLLERVGGFTEHAYPYASRFSRQAIATLQKKEMTDMADRLETAVFREITASSKSTSASDTAILIAPIIKRLRETVPDGRLVVNMAQGIKGIKGTTDDVLLEGGDAIRVPKKPYFVLVVGAVYNSNAFSYNNEKTVIDYIEMAGGYTEEANEGSIYVMKANGEVVPASKRGFFARSALQMGPGDVIVVPEKIKLKDSMETVKDMSQILYQLALTTASLKTVGLIQ